MSGGGGGGGRGVERVYSCTFLNSEKLILTVHSSRLILRVNVYT